MKAAVILAAGIGSRLRPLTLDKPKGMIRAAGKPILEHQLEAYEEAGFDRVYLLGGFRADMIRSWLALRQGRMAVEMVENTEFDSTNNMYSLWMLRDRLRGQPFYLSNGDVVFGRGILDRMLAAGQGSAIAVDRSLFMEESMKIVLDGQKRIRGISKRYTEKEAFAVSIDVYRFSADASKNLFEIADGYIVQKQERHHWTEVALDQLLQAKDHDFQPVDIEGQPWVEVDNLVDLAQADLLFCAKRQNIARAKAFVFDIDGTTTIDGKPIPGVLDVIRKLQKDRAVLFCTNNSSRKRSDYSDMLSGLGLKCTVNDIVSSTGSAVSFLRNHRMKDVFVLGTPQLKEELAAAGFTHTDKNPGMVIVGFDKTLNFENASIASNLIAKGCPYILTHPDVSCPTPAGPVPDAGAIGAMLQTATGVAPLAVLGKPSREMLQPLFDEKGLKPGEVVMIGDRLTTDTKMARNCGCLSVLVLSGITSRLEADRSDITPSLILESAAGLEKIIS